MSMKLIKIIGQPLCIILYIVSLYFAVKKNFSPLAALLSLHLTEYFAIGRNVGKRNGFSEISTFLHCLAFGFTWWLPVKNEKK